MIGLWQPKGSEFSEFSFCWFSPEFINLYGFSFLVSCMLSIMCRFTPSLVPLKTPYSLACKVLNKSSYWWVLWNVSSLPCLHSSKSQHLLSCHQHIRQVDSKLWLRYEAENLSRLFSPEFCQNQVVHSLRIFYVPSSTESAAPEKVSILVLFCSHNWKSWSNVKLQYLWISRQEV